MSSRLFTIRIDESDYARIVAMARRCDRTVSDVVRVLLRRCDVETIVRTVSCDHGQVRDAS